MSNSKNSEERKINFMGQRYIAMVVSAILLLASIISLGVNGLQFGLDFTGGLQIEPQYSEAVDIDSVKTVLASNGFKDAVVVNFGSERDLKITMQQSREDVAKAQLLKNTDNLSLDDIAVDTIRGSNNPRRPNGALEVVFTNANEATQQSIDSFFRSMENEYSITSLDDSSFTVISPDGLQTLTENVLVNILSSSTESQVTIKRTEFVGPQVGDELRDQGGIGMLFALAVVMVYVALRFQFKFSVAAVCALIHDVIIVLGFFSIFKLVFDLTVLAAVLAVIGYSLNDTIVVSDRIRENFRKIRKVNAVDVVNISLTQTLGRTLVTSLTTMLVLLALFFVGGELIHAFSIALIIGIFVGTYSSIYVAANILLFMDITKEDLIVQVQTEGAEIDDMP